MNYLLDTNVISELISKQSDKKVVDWLDRLASAFGRDVAPFGR
jgi:predicted nucleic acid-binding protein